MKLLYVVEDFDPTFVFTNVGMLIGVAQTLGWQVDILTTANERNRDLDTFTPGVPLLKLAAPRDTFAHVRRYGGAYGLVLSYNLRRHNLLLPWLRARHGTSFVLKTDGQVGSSTSSLRERARTRLMVRMPLERAQAVLVESPGIEAKVREVAPRARTVLVPNCISPALEAYHAERARVERKPVILYVGRLSPEKGVDVLVSAFEVLAQRHAEWTVELVGPVHDAEHERELRRMVAKGGLQSRVVFGGGKYGTRLYDRYAAASIFCLPSRREGMSNVLTDAMSFGLAIAATDVGEAQYQLDGGNCGLIAQPDDVIALAQRLDALLSDRGLRRALGDSARKRVNEHFMLDTRRAALAEALRLPPRTPGPRGFL